VLVDVGASGTPPRLWRDLASLSYYVGFDPDRRELTEDNSFGFRRFVIFNKAVTETDRQELEFYMTASPYCSSALKPNPKNLCEYSFTDLFRVERTTMVPATTLESALRESRLGYIDWLKLDSQGKDLDILCSLGDVIGRRLLVLDIEPGVTDFYEGENTFSPAHSYLLENDFWLSRARFQKCARISKATREVLAPYGTELSLLPGNPTAVEAQYVRTLGHLVSTQAALRDCVCLWVLCMLNRNYGFALDVGIHVVEQDSDRQLGTLLVQQTLTEIERHARTRGSRLERVVKAWVPSTLHPLARKVRRRKSG
jgi:hypothetical protein